MKFKFLIVIFVIVTVMNHAFARTDSDSPLFRVSGYGTVGAVYNSNSDADAVRDLLQNKGAGHTRRTDFGVDSLLGLQLDLAPASELGGSVQVVSRRKQENYQPEITWAFGRYSPNDTVQLRAGRLGFDVYMLADSRNVGYSYPWVRPPVEYFGPLVVSYIDGADMVLKAPLFDGTVRAKFYAGTAQEKYVSGNAERDSLSLAGSPLMGAYLEYQNRHWQFRTGYAQLKFENEFSRMDLMLYALSSPILKQLVPDAAEIADHLGFKDKKINYISAGIFYDDGPLQAQLLLSEFQSKIISFPSNYAGYATVSYRVEKWLPYATYSAIRPKGTPKPLNLPLGLSPDLDQIAIGYRDLSQSQLADQSSLSLGVRYDFAEKMDVKFQVDHIRSNQQFMMRNIQPGWNGKSTLVSVTFDFIF